MRGRSAPRVRPGSPRLLQKAIWRFCTEGALITNVPPRHAAHSAFEFNALQDANTAMAIDRADQAQTNFSIWLQKKCKQSQSMF